MFIILKLNLQTIFFQLFRINIFVRQKILHHYGWFYRFVNRSEDKRRSFRQYLWEEKSFLETPLLVSLGFCFYFHGCWCCWWWAKDRGSTYIRSRDGDEHESRYIKPLVGLTKVCNARRIHGTPRGWLTSETLPHQYYRPMNQTLRYQTFNRWCW